MAVIQRDEELLSLSSSANMFIVVAAADDQEGHTEHHKQYRKSRYTSRGSAGEGKRRWYFSEGSDTWTRWVGDRCV